MKTNNKHCVRPLLIHNSHFVHFTKISHLQYKKCHLPHLTTRLHYYLLIYPPGVVMPTKTRVAILDAINKCQQHTEKQLYYQN